LNHASLYYHILSSSAVDDDTFPTSPFSFKTAARSSAYCGPKVLFNHT